jgi:DNA-binding transcriptional MerR regulator
MDMPSQAERLLTIGEFSRLSMISVRMLRYYDVNGVLHPTWTDPGSGYRHYSASLLETARRVRELRDVGLGVVDLAVCASSRDPQAMREILRRHHQRLRTDAAVIADRLRGVDHLIASLEETMSVEISHRVLPARTVASLRDHIATYAEEGQLWQRLMAALPTAHARMAQTAQAVAVFHDKEYVEANPDVEVRLDVEKPFTAVGEVRCVEVPEQEVACGTLLGGYEGMGTVTEAIGEWVVREGYRFAGPMFNVYLVGPGQESDPSRWVTEVCFPVVRDGDGG